MAKKPVILKLRAKKEPKNSDFGFEDNCVFGVFASLAEARAYAGAYLLKNTYKFVRV
jgi:hypothetical protein